MICTRSINDFLLMHINEVSLFSLALAQGFLITFAGRSTDWFYSQSLVKLHRRRESFNEG